MINKAKILKTLKYIFLTLLSVTVIAVISGMILFFYYVATAPKLSQDQLIATNSSLIYDIDNNLIADLGSENRESAETSEIPKQLSDAIIAIEDHRFNQHKGIDAFRIIGSAIHNLTSNTTQGGSTLTQQLIKLTYFSTSEEDQNLKRKAQEAWLALQMEREYTKEEILTYYVNKVYMANGFYGMRTASKNYYGKDLQDLSLAQIALLAGMPQAPNQYDPYTNPDAAQERRDTVLSQMLRYGDISQEEYDAAVATPITDGLKELTEQSAYDSKYDNYLKQVIEQVEEKTGLDIFNSGLNVYTNLDTEKQDFLDDVLNTYNYVSFPDDELQAAVTIIDTKTGRVFAQLGGRNQEENVSFGTNQAVETNRDWGSTMKPLTAYGPAIEKDVYTSTSDTVYDTAYYWPGTDTPVYNWDRSYSGTMTLQTALQQSRNVPAVKALEATGLDYASEFLSGLGINYPELFYSNAISSNTTESGNEYGASSEKMAAAYAAFGNNGVYNEPMYINKIEFMDGSVTEYEANSNQAMSPETAYMITSMLKTVFTYGTGTAAQIAGLNHAGKTGTSNYTDEELESIGYNTGIWTSNVGTMAPDELFVGYTTDLSIAVWTGYEDRLTPLYNTKLDLAKNIYRVLMSNLSGGYSPDFDIPSGVYTDGSYVTKSGYSTNRNILSSTSSSSYRTSSSSNEWTYDDNTEDASTNNYNYDSSSDTNTNTNSNTETSQNYSYNDNQSNNSNFNSYYDD